MKLVHGWIEGVGGGCGRLYVREGESVADALWRWCNEFERQAYLYEVRYEACRRALEELDDKQGRLL